jgi:hypothetical protein
MEKYYVRMFDLDGFKMFGRVVREDRYVMVVDFGVASYMAGCGKAILRWKTFPFPEMSFDFGIGELGTEWSS